MKAKKGTTPGERDIRRVRDEIRSSWCPEEQRRRQQLAELRQEWLVRMLFSQPAAVSARVA
jgi:hypothetical protein